MVEVVEMRRSGEIVEVVDMVLMIVKIEVVTPHVTLQESL